MNRIARSLPLLLAVVACLARGSAASAAPETADEWNDRGVALTERGEFREAAECFRKALEGEPTSTVIRRNLALARGNLGVALLKSGDAAGAEAETRAALEAMPDDAILHLNLAACLDERGYPVRAAVSVRRAVSLGPDIAAVQEKLGGVCFREGDLPGAVAAWRRTLELEPDNTMVPSRLERALAALEAEKGLTEDASTHFVIRYDQERHAVLASLVLKELETIHGVVSAEFQAVARGRLPVILSSRAAFQAATGTQGWVAGLFDGRVHLPVKDEGERTEDLLARARHEYLHAVLAPLGKRAPTWLHEGLAQRLEGRPADRAAARIAATPAPLPLAEISQSFVRDVGADEARVLYDTSLAFVAWLRQGEREAGFRATMEALFSGADLELAFERSYHEPLAALYLQFGEETWKKEEPR